ncbi:MAG: transposase [Planctomycetes bacterium]|nr:transposase [Planctomycetota bacterium]
MSLDEAKRLTEAWREDYNRALPHTSLGHRTPLEFTERVDRYAHRPPLSGLHPGWIKDRGRLRSHLRIKSDPYDEAAAGGSKSLMPANAAADHAAAVPEP